MTITITKHKVSPEVIPETTESEFATRIDEVGKIAEKLEAARKKLAEVAPKELATIDTLQKQLKAETDKLFSEINDAYDASVTISDDEKRVEQGVKFQVEVGAKSRERFIKDMPTLAKMLDKVTKGLFLKLATVKIGDIDQYLTPMQKEEVLEVKRGKRTLKLDRKV